MVLEHNPSAKMQVRSRGQLVAPACCCVCGNATCEEGYLDLGAFVDFHGTLYLCMTCVYQGGETCGMFTPDEVKQLEGLANSLAEANEQLASELRDANAHIANFDRLMRAAFAASDGVGPPVSEGVPEPTERPKDRESEVTEPTPFSDPESPSGPQLRHVTFD